MAGAPAARVRPFANELGVSYPLLVGSWADFESYGVRSVPAVYLVDPSGEVVETGLDDCLEELAARLP